MQKQTLILIGAITCAASAAVAQEAVHRTVSEQQQEKEQAGGKKYTCPMHPEVVMDHPGHCPKCGMELVPLKPKSKRLSEPYALRSRRPTPNAEPASHDIHGEHATHAMQESDQHGMSMQSSV